MTEKRDEMLVQRRTRVANKVAKTVVKQLERRVSDKAREDELDDLLVLLDRFEEALAKKLLERKPVALLCNESPDIFFMGLVGMEKLTPYFRRGFSIEFDWKVGHATITYF